MRQHHHLVTRSPCHPLTPSSLPQHLDLHQLTHPSRLATAGDGVNRPVGRLDAVRVIEHQVVGQKDRKPRGGELPLVLLPDRRTLRLDPASLCSESCSIRNLTMGTPPGV